MRKRWGAGAGLFAIAALAGCARQLHLPADEVDEKAVVILEPWDTARYTQATARVLADALPEAARLPLARFDIALQQARERRQVLVVPHAEVLPVEVWGPLDEFVENGGCALLWAARPFAARVWSAPGGMQDEAALAETLAARARPLAWPPARAWLAGPGPRGPGALLRVAAGARLPWPGVEVDASAAVRLSSEWDAASAPDEAALVFFARGGARAGQLLVELGDGSGTWWSARCEVGPEWSARLLPRAAFDGPRPLPSLSVVRALRIGPPADGPAPPYYFGCSDLRWAVDPRPAPPRAPQCPGVPAGDAVWALPATAFELPDGARRPHDGGSVPAIAETPRPDAWLEGGPARFVPLVAASAGSPDRTGVCARIGADLRPGRPARRCGWLGLEAGAADEAVLRAALRGAVGRLQFGSLIVEGGLGAATVREGDPLVIQYRYLPAAAMRERHVRLNAELIDADRRVVRRVSATPREPDLQKLDFGRAPEAPAGVEDYTLRMRVVDALAVTIVDEISWPLRVVSARDHVPPRRPVEAVGSLMADTGRPVFPLFLAWDDPARPGRFLHPACYPATRVAGWLDRALELGLNAVTVAVDDPALMPQYEHLAGELESRRMFALVQLPGLPTLGTDWAAARTLLQELARRRTEPVIAFDLAPGAGRAAGAEEWGAAWRAWLVEQFGTSAAAAAALGLSGPAEAEGAWSAPAAPPASPLALARRRCRADLTARHLTAAGTLLKSCGLLHALTYAPPADGSLDPADLAAVLDVQLLDAPDLSVPDTIGAAAFRAAWARGRANGKPVWWQERGPAVAATAGPAVLADQAKRWANFFHLLQRTGAAGGRLAPPADGLPVFLTAAGSWRPAADAIRLFSHQLRGAALVQAAPWRDRAVDDWSDARGADALLAEWGGVYGAVARKGEMVELRPSGFGRETRSLEAHPLVGSAGPWRELNALWAGARVNRADVWRAPGGLLSLRLRDRVQLTIRNTGSALWTPWTGSTLSRGAVWISVIQDGREMERLRLPRLAMGQAGPVEWIPSTAGRFLLRADMEPTGPWGEALEVLVAP